VAIITARVSNADEAIQRIKEMMQLYRRFTPHRYFACLTPDGLTFVPLVSSRHAHTISIVIESDEDGTQYEKVLEFVKKMGFKVWDRCQVKPESS